MNNFFKKKRVIFFTSICCALVVAIIIKYFILAIQPVPQKAKNIPVIERGTIADRTGFALAISTNFYRIGINAKAIKNKEEFCKVMAPVLDTTESELYEKINVTRKNDYIILKKKATQSEYDDIRAIALENDFIFVNYEKIPGRIYPNDNLAAHLIGYMGDEGKGLAGIEFSQQDILYPPVDKALETPEQGKNIYLSIEANLQYKLEQIAFETMKNTQAESMMMIAADSNTGEILSYISLPSVDLNE